MDTGRSLWTYDVKPDGGQSFHGAVLLWRDLVIVGTDGRQTGQLYGFEQATGRVRWQKPLVVSSDVLADGERIVVVAEEFASDDVTCLDAATGRIVWQIPVTRPPEDEEPITNLSAAVRDGRVFFAGRDGTLRALDVSTGAVLWERSLGSPASTSTVLHDGSVFVGLQSGDLLRFAAESGRLQSEHSLGGMPARPPTPTDSSVAVFVGWMGAGGTITALDASLREIRWRRAAPRESRWTSARPFLWQDAVLLGTSAGEIFALELTTGLQRYGWRFGGTIRVIHVSGDVWFVGTVEGRLAACTPH